MPTHNTETSGILPASGTYNYSQSVFAMPTGAATPAIQARLVGGSLTTLDGQVIHISTSGVIMVASGLSDWVGLEMS
jgi:hypothetical protein